MILSWSIFHFGYHFNQRGLITVLVKKNDFVDKNSADVDEENDDDRYWDCKM